MKNIVILHNVRSAHNVGSVFRTADGAGISKIFLTGYTPAPIDRFGRERQEILKTSLGATKTVAWEFVEDINSVIRTLKSEGVAIVAVEQHARSIDHGSYVQEADTAFIFGNEIDGVDTELCESADVVLHIKMHGKKESLNVSVAVGIILFTFAPKEGV